MEDIYLRIATPEDANDLLSIYAPYVMNTAITYEYAVPSVEEFRARIKNTLKKYPYIVAMRGNEPVGYAYTGAFHPRASYAWDVEASIYVRRDCHGLGLGRRLYDALEKLSQAQNMINLYACIAYPEKDDEYLTQNSMQFHSHLGFELIATFKRCAYKFGRWYGMIWMQKIINPHSPNPSPVVPFPQIDNERLKEAGIRV